MMFKKIAEIFGAAPTKEISGERLYEHLKNIGIDAEVIPKGSPDDLELSESKYSFTIKVKGLHIDVIQIYTYEIGIPRRSSLSSYQSYDFEIYFQFDYIVRNYEGNKILRACLLSTRDMLGLRHGPWNWKAV
ncbi:hypothetical protein MYX64_01045 [Nitrospinae bacterium AH_259_B05_G02_I21]|nr:hypothetical protein [Nitrospinae bacterium AH_259_B05_G02_I21]MDA2932412.1 hypothetical protein [Nitrospinae bacterium AH-259-F20]